MAKVNKSAKKKEWVQKGDHRKEIRSDDDELFPYWKGHQSLNDLKKVAYEVLDWAKNTDRPTINSFLSERSLHPSRMSEWRERSPELNHAWEIAKGIIGDRREEKALLGEYNASIVLSKMYQYDPEHKAWKEKLAQKASEGAVIKVEVQTISSDIPKKIEEE